MTAPPNQQNRNNMRSQVRFAMQPADEHEFEQLLVGDESIRFFAGPLCVFLFRTVSG